MTRSEINATVELMKAAGRKNVPVPLSEWKEMAMAATVKGKVVEKKTGKKKFVPADTRPVNRKIGDKKKADRTVSRLKDNAAKARGK